MCWNYMIFINIAIIFFFFLILLCHRFGWIVLSCFNLNWYLFHVTGVTTRCSLLWNNCTCFFKVKKELKVKFRSRKTTVSSIYSSNLLCATRLHSSFRFHCHWSAERLKSVFLKHGKELVSSTSIMCLRTVVFCSPSCTSFSQQRPDQRASALTKMNHPIPPINDCDTVSGAERLWLRRSYKRLRRHSAVVLLQLNRLAGYYLKRAHVILFAPMFWDWTQPFEGDCCPTFSSSWFSFLSGWW